MIGNGVCGKSGELDQRIYFALLIRAKRERVIHLLRKWGWLETVRVDIYGREPS
jgi:hypothetical protein